MADHMTAEQLWDERRAFEAFAISKGWSTMPAPYDEYFDQRTRAGWAAWKALATRLPTLPAQGDGWLPIESAPRDGSRIELWIPGCGGQGTATHGHWVDQRYSKKPSPYWGYDSTLRASDMRARQPSHWKRVTPAPKAKDHG